MYYGSYYENNVTDTVFLIVDTVGAEFMFHIACNEISSTSWNFPKST